MSDLVAFLKARLDEDEAAARNASPHSWTVTRDPLGVHVENGDGRGRIVMASGADRVDDRGVPNAEHIARHDPARVLREVQLKRTLLSWLVSPASGEPLPLLIGETVADLGRGRGTVIPEQWVLREMAVVYSDHPDYRAEWSFVAAS